MALLQDFGLFNADVIFNLIIELHIKLSFVQCSPHLKLLFSGHKQSIVFDMFTLLFAVVSKQFFPFRQKSDDLCFKLKHFLTGIYLYYGINIT